MTEIRFRLLDTDSHVAEPRDLWDGEYMDPRYRGGSPMRFVDNTDDFGRRQTTLYDQGAILLDNAAYQAAAGIPLEKLIEGITYEEANHGGWDITKRLADMDLEGIAIQVVNPSAPGLRLGFIDHPPLAAAMCRAYNDWVVEHCSGGQGRVLANMVIPWQDLDLAMAELERMAGQDCIRGVITRPAPEYPTGFIGDTAFDPMYSFMEEADLTLILHSCAPDEGLAGPMTRHYKRTRPYWHAAYTYGIVVGFPAEAAAAFTQLVFEGVLDRHPRLKVMITESHGGWLPTLLDRMDEWAKGSAAMRTIHQMTLELLPSEYLARQGFVVFESDESAMSYAAERIAGSMVWALDYPHADCTFPGGADEFKQNLEKLPAAVQQAIAWDNGARAFGVES